MVCFSSRVNRSSNLFYPPSAYLGFLFGNSMRLHASSRKPYCHTVAPPTSHFRERRNPRTTKEPQASNLEAPEVPRRCCGGPSSLSAARYICGPAGRAAYCGRLIIAYRAPSKETPVRWFKSNHRRLQRSRVRAEIPNRFANGTGRNQLLPRRVALFSDCSSGIPPRIQASHLRVDFPV